MSDTKTPNAGQEPIPEIYTLDGDPPFAITCLRCHWTSYNQNDVDHRYCGRCHQMLDDIWPPARAWWLESIKKPRKPL